MIMENIKNKLGKKNSSVSQIEHQKNYFNREFSQSRKYELLDWQKKIHSKNKQIFIKG